MAKLPWDGTKEYELKQARDRILQKLVKMENAVGRGNLRFVVINATDEHPKFYPRVFDSLSGQDIAIFDSENWNDDKNDIGSYEQRYQAQIDALQYAITLNKRK